MINHQIIIYVIAGDSGDSLDVALLGGGGDSTVLVTIFAAVVVGVVGFVVAVKLSVDFAIIAESAEMRLFL